MSGISMNIHLAAPVARVWEHLTDRDKLAIWLMESDLVPELGASFTYSAEPMGTWDGAVHCEIKDIVEFKRFSYTWSANDLGVETLVTFELSEEGDGTRLELTHVRFEGAQPGAEGRHAAGWTSCFTALKKALCGPGSGYDWSEMQITQFVEAPLADVFAMWGTSAGMQSFWPDVIACTRPDGTTRPPGETYRHGDLVAMTFPTHGSTELEITNIELNKFVSFSFGEGYGWVTIRVSEEGGRTKIVIRQFGSSTDGEAPWEIHAHARGWWTFNLVNLKSVLLHGKDLRIRTLGAENGLGAAYLPPGSEGAPGHHDWTAFDIHLQIDAAPEDTLNRWRSAAGLESFFVAEAIYSDDVGARRGAHESIQEGDAYIWRGIHDFETKGRITEASPGRIAFTFSDRYACEITATGNCGGTLLHLHQSGMRDELEDRVRGSLNCRCCWISYLTVLKAQLEHGIDLRDQNPDTADSFVVKSSG